MPPVDRLQELALVSEPRQGFSYEKSYQQSAFSQEIINLTG